MLFAELAVYFEKLQETSSRLELIRILSVLFNKAEEGEVALIVYLLQGRLVPFFVPLEMGMADKHVASSLARAYNSTKEHVLTLYNKLGDMGLVASQLNSKFKIQNSKLSLSIKVVFDELTVIAKTSGDGSVEKKISLFADLLSSMDSISAKHLARIPLGNNRLGIGDMTILDGLATAKLGDKSKRKLLEKAYNETSDLGLIAKTLFQGGLQEVGHLTVTVGRPIRSELCERLPNAQKVMEKMAFQNGVHVSVKYDGFRVQIHKNGNEVRMYSRNLEDMTEMFPELIEATIRQVQAKTAILDTEALSYQPESEEFLPFQETTKRRRKHNILETAQNLPLKAFVFDILYLDGKSLLETPLLTRMQFLTKTIKDKDILIPSPGEIVTTADKLQLILDDAISKGLEGVVVKRVDSFYEAGARNFNWVKLKRHSSGRLQDTIDCVVLGYIVGRGKRTSFGAGALLVGVYDKKKDEFVTVSKIGTGLTDEEWREIHKRADKIKLAQKPARVSSLLIPSVWVRPEIVIEVLADEITRSPLHTAAKEEIGVGLALRFPRLVSFRDQDKRAEDATTVQELIDMYQRQNQT